MRRSAVCLRSACRAGHVARHALQTVAVAPSMTAGVQPKSRSRLQLPPSSFHGQHQRSFSSGAGGAEGAGGAGGASAEDLGAHLAGGADRRFVFVGGKGGVGKTTTASALAVRLARSGRKTLIVSTDPAHSLGDALATELSGTPQELPLNGLDPQAQGRLFAMEINQAEVVEEFRKALSIDRLRELLQTERGGIGVGLLSALAKAGVDMETLVSFLDMSPPGIDEAVALARLMQLLSDQEHDDFERVVIDTAPTGHTLRLLAFPQFLHGLVGTLLTVSEQVSGFALAPRLLGNLLGDDFRQQLRNTKGNLERFMASMHSLTAVLEDLEATSFVVVSVPTQLAVAESKRLLQALEQSQMPARHVVINQCPFIGAVGDGSHDYSIAVAAATEKLEKHVEAKRSDSTEGQSGPSGDFALSASELNALHLTMRRLARHHVDARRQADRLSAYASGLSVYQVPVFDEEPTGIVALDRYADALVKSSCAQE